MTERATEKDRLDVRSTSAAGEYRDGVGVERDTNPDSAAAAAAGAAAGARDRSVASLLKELRDEMMTLWRQELALAKTEMSEKASKAGRNAVYIGIGGAVLFAGLLFLLVGVSALVYVGLVYAGLSHYLAGWLAPVITGAVVAVIGYVMLQKGISTLKRMSPVPQKTVESMKEDKQWLQNQTK